MVEPDDQPGSENGQIRVQLLNDSENGGRGQDRTADPFDVNEVLSR